MYLFLTDNLLKINNVINLAENDFSPGDADNLASVKPSKANIKALYEAGIHFLLDLEDGKGKLPKTLEFKRYTDGLEMYVPEYVPTRKEKPQTYSVEFVKRKKKIFKSGVTESGIEKALLAGIKIKRLTPEAAGKFKKAFIKKFDLEVIKEGGFQYAIFGKATAVRKLSPIPRRKSARA